MYGDWHADKVLQELKRELVVHNGLIGCPVQYNQVFARQTIHGYVQKCLGSLSARSFLLQEEKAQS